MSVGPDPQVENQVEQARRQVNRLVEEIANLSELELSPAEYYGEFLQRILAALGAPAGAVWIRTPQGNLQLQYQINMGQVGLSRTEQSRQMHDELLRQVAMKAQPGIFPPNSSSGDKGPGNPTDLFILLAPILYDKQLAGMVEVWTDPMRGVEAQRNSLQFVLKMASLASGYTRNHQLRQMVGQQQVWVQLENFSRQIHNSLNPIEVSYLVANEGRRLVECDRVSVALRMASKPQVQAISGADVVEKRSNLVQLMRTLFEEVMKWGERLVYSGTKDDSLPPGVLKALDAYLAESNSKLLVVMPLKDEREAKSKWPPRSGIMMESFEPAATAEQMLARLEVIGRHSTSALYNASEYRRIPGRWIWLPLAKVQEGLGGKTRAIITLSCAAAVLLILAMILLPYPLKMEAKGSLLPTQRAYLFTPQEGQVRDIIPPGLKSGSYVTKDTELFRMFDQNLGRQVLQLQQEIVQAGAQLEAFGRPGGGENQFDASMKRKEAMITKEAKTRELQQLIQRTRASTTNPGEFILRAPLSGIILTPDFRENLVNRTVKPNEPLLRIGQTDAEPRFRKVGEWEIELKIPQKHIGQVLEAYKYLPDGAELDVDMLVVSAPTRTFRGKLAHNKIASQANPNRDDNNEPEPAVFAWVRIAGADIAEDGQLTPELLLTGTEVHTRIRCGNRALGYSLFYGVWEFIYEKVVFFF